MRTTTATLTLLVAVLSEISCGFHIAAPTVGSFQRPTTNGAFSMQSFRSANGRGTFLKLSSEQNEQESSSVTTSDDESDPMEEAMMDAEELKQLEKIRRAEELRAQEVFMKKSTGIHKCTNCDWEYDETKGDAMMIGGMIQPGTKFEELPSNWRCPVCRASKDSFEEVVEEIPGFEVNQGYGFGTNSWTAGQKNLAVFGGLAFFFLLFIGGYALS